MLHWAVVFFIISVIAGVFGFTRLSGAASRIAQVLFFIAFTMFVLVLLTALGLGALFN